MFLLEKREVLHQSHGRIPKYVLSIRKNPACRILRLDWVASCDIYLLVAPTRETGGS